MKLQITKKLLKLNYDLYESQAEDFSQTRSKIWEWPIIDLISKIKPSTSVLDLGCGNTRLCDAIAKHGPLIEFNSGSKQMKEPKTKNHPSLLGCRSEAERSKTQIKDVKIEYLGIDTSKQLIQLNNKRYKDLSTSLEMTIRFIVKNGLEINYKNKFDYVICLAVLHHIPSEKLQLKFLKNIYQALRSKGKVLISVWNRWTPRYQKYFSKIYKSDMIKMYPPQSVKYSLSALVRELGPSDLIVPWKNSGKFRFIHCFTKEELAEFAKQVGFKNIKTFYADKEKITTKNSGLNVYLEAEK